MSVQLVLTFDSAKGALEALAKLGGAVVATVKSDEDAPKKRGRPPGSTKKAKEEPDAELEDGDDDLDDDADEETDEDDGDELDDEDEENEKPAPKKSAKAKAPTAEDVLTAGKAYMKKHGKEKAHAVLKKLKVAKVSDVKEDERAKAIKLFAI